jgi:putative DNA primase/helicase
MSPPLQKLYDIFGAGVVFLPLPKGSKQPLIKKWQNITFADTQKTAYQQALETCISRGGNIGVLLGPTSDGLISIDLDRDELVDQFIALCPKLALTTRTRGKRGCNFFLRLVPGTAYPNSQSSYILRDADGNKCGEWRCGGGNKGAQTVIYGEHPDGALYQIPVENTPVELIFDTDLQWFYPFDSPGPARASSNATGTATNPSNSQGQSQNGQTPSAANVTLDPHAAYGQLLAEIGEPFIKTQRGYTINQPFFARLFGINRTAFWDIKSKDYYAYNADNGQYERLCQETTFGLIKADIFTEAAVRSFPAVGSKVSISLLKSIAELVRSDELASHKDFFLRNPRELPVIHAANGMFRLEKDGTISRHEFSPKFRSRNLIPVAYDKDAQAPHFKTKLLNGLSEEDSETLQRYYGLVLIGGNRAQKLLMLLGKGGVGKGTIVRLGNLIIGRANTGQLRVSEIGGRFESYRLIGKLLLTVVEATHDCLEKRGAETIKALVGHDPMDAEKKYATDPVPFDGTFPVIYVSNEDPNIRLFGDESAWSRRLVPLLFPNERPPGSEVVDNYEEVLFEEEAEGILAWMMEGARSHWAELLDKKGFATTETQKRRTQEIIARSKSVLTFVLNGLKASGTGDLTTDELFEGYVTFCINNNWRPYPERKFAELVRPLILQHFGIGQSHDVIRTKQNGNDATLRGYRGLEIK